MQVSYGRNGRNNAGTKNFGKRSGNVDNSGGVGHVPKMNAINRIDEVGKIDIVKKGSDSVKVLSDISNRGKASNEQWSNHPKKLLEVNKGRFNKPFKEIVKGEILGSIGKVYRVGKQSKKLDDNQQKRMEDDLTDSDVLKALHQEMLDSVLTDKDIGESSIETVGDSGLVVCIE
ncbi:hypothetical protein LWI29_022098 [Acer saccharum]|uniref:Uncharacterized protein n=1 Tax=Acer saccharum TaxID=4024 RepID=A0AA39S161_ACESA|nr:hypothetical protein LWI29_022098 [Acer saccharum]